MDDEQKPRRFSNVDAAGEEHIISELEIYDASTETEPNLKNATSTGSFKPAILETGLTISVPQFITEGERVKVNTDSGEYVERG